MVVAEELGNVDEKVSDSYFPSSLAGEGASAKRRRERGRKKASHRRRRHLIRDLSELLLAQEDVEPCRDDDCRADQRGP